MSNTIDLLRTIIVYLIGKLYRPLLERYLSRERTYVYNKIKLAVAPGVFHPGFFFSTRILLKYMIRLPLNGKSFLELGAGSGLIALTASRLGAIVTASDINPTATEYLMKNSDANHLAVEIVTSDLFSAIPQQTFDFIALNPPYYLKDPKSDAEHAWYCGKNGEYFNRLFSQLGKYTHQHTRVMMVLCDGCDLAMVRGYARAHNWRLNTVFEKANIIETNYVFSIDLLSTPAKASFKKNSAFI